MTRQNKINYRSPLAQNLFLLSQNKNFIQDLKTIKREHQKELAALKKNRQIPFLIGGETGSKKLQRDIECIIRKSPLYPTPKMKILRSFAVFLLVGNDTQPILKGIEEDKEINMLIPPIPVKIIPEENNITITLSFTPYHTKTDAKKAIDKNWFRVDKVTEKYKAKTTLKIKKPQPITDFERDWKIYQGKTVKKQTYKDLADNFGETFVNVVEIVKQIRKRISSLYPSK